MIQLIFIGYCCFQVIPALSTFCIYATIGVFALYILQATYFVACLTLDQRRVDAKRNACILCYTHKIDYIQNKHYRFSVQNTFLKHIWGPLLTKRPIKVSFFTYGYKNDYFVLRRTPGCWIYCQSCINCFTR